MMKGKATRMYVFLTLELCKNPETLNPKNCPSVSAEMNPEP